MKLVAKLETIPEREHKQIEEMLKELAEAHATGKVKALVYAYTEKDDNAAYFSISSSARLSTFAYLVAVLQHKLISWMSESE